MSQNKRAGIIQLKVEGIQYDAKGEFTYNLGYPLNTAIEGTDSVHGFATKVQVPTIEGKITDSGTLDVKSILTMVDVTVTVSLENGKIISGKDMWYAGEGNVTTNEGEIGVKFQAREQLEEIS